MMALSGTLKDFGISEIFQLIGQQQKAGLLHVSQREEKVHVAFKDGMIVHAESSGRGRRELLGDRLVRAGLINENQLAEALEVQKLTLKRLGDILVQSGIIERAVLKEMAQLQTGETLYRLFAWKSGTYAFEATEVDFDPNYMTPVRAEGLLMEGFRRLDEWPAIRKKISNLSMTFERCRELPVETHGHDQEVEDAFDDAFGEQEKKGSKKEGEKGEFRNIGENERRVYALVEPGRDVQWLMDRSRLGEFETCKALLVLLNAGYVQQGDAVRARRGTGEKQSRGVERLRGVVGWGATTLVLLAVCGVILTRARVSPWVADKGDYPASDPALWRVASRAQLTRIEMALGMFAVQTGRLPQSLDELTASGILTENDLRFPWHEPYYYRKASEGAYVLLPPLR